jgi:hypothetical protein
MYNSGAKRLNENSIRSVYCEVRTTSKAQVILNDENEGCLRLHWTRRRPTQKTSSGGTFSGYKINKIRYRLPQTSWANRSLVDNVVCTYASGHAVAQLVETLRYKPEGRRFDSRLCHWILHLHNPSAVWPWGSFSL